MISDSAILDAFFEECEDLLTALTDGLAQMCEDQTDDETVNAVFRSVHSIKGAAGAFSMEDLVGFAHKFETVLDELRANRLNSDQDLLRVLQRAGDVLSDLVDNARAGVAADPEKVDPVLAELQAFLGAEDAPEEEFVFEALSVGLDEPAASTSYVVSFHPGPDFYRTGNDPLLVLRALAELGPIQVECDVSELPADTEHLEVGGGYLTWKVEVSEQTNDLRIREIFEFVDDLCALKIVESQIDETHEPALAEASLSAFLPPPEDITAAISTAEQQSEAPVSVTPEKQEKLVKKAAATLRVDPERVDRLINAVGELIINQSVISQRIQEASLPSSSDLFADLDDYKLLAREIQEGVMAIRAQPVKPLFQRMLRIAREASDATGKSVKIVVEGEDTEVDKIVVERLADPLTHMIRNAIDHGIEKPQERIAAGKQKTGTLVLRARQSSGSIVIQIVDDGAGLNRAKIQAIAIEKGLIGSDDQLTDAEIDHLLFAPGFSTASEVTNLSGRGVGMDVVKTAITELGGKITISSAAGEGTTFSITLPLTLAVMDGMVISVGDQTMVVPIASILETVRPVAADLSRIGVETNLLRVRGEFVPIVDLASSLGSGSNSKPLIDRVLLLIHSESTAQCALAVDKIYDQRQVVVKSMIGNYGAIPGISGATILGDGKIALIVDPEYIAAPPVASTPTPHNINGEHAIVGSA